MNKQYTIDRITDVAKIPEDRLPAFFADLVAAHKANDLQTGFIWTDDDIIGITEERYRELGIQV